MTGLAIAEKKDTRVSPGKMVSWICCAVVFIAVLSCFAMAFVRSKGLTHITVTALDKKKEPRDAGLPLWKRHDTLPDYELLVCLHSGSKINLGAKPNRSAIEGLTWSLSDPISVSEIASLRLQDQDKVISDPIAEVHYASDSVEEANYRFDFETERSISVGVKSFFTTPVGSAIVAAFFVATLVMVFGFFCA